MSDTARDQTEAPADEPGLIPGAPPWERVADASGAKHLIAPAPNDQPTHISVLPSEGEEASAFHRVGMHKHLDTGVTHQTRWPVAELKLASGQIVRLYVDGHRIVMTTRDVYPAG